MADKNEANDALQPKADDCCKKKISGNEIITDANQNTSNQAIVIKEVAEVNTASQEEKTISKEENSCCKKEKQAESSEQDKLDSKETFIDDTGRSTSKQLVQSEQTDWEKLADMCSKATETFNADAILQLVVTTDLSQIKDPKILKSLFRDHLTRLPHKVVSELLSVLIAILKKSVFHQESSRGLLIPCIDYLVQKKHNQYSDQQPSLSSQQQRDDGSAHSNESLTKHFLREWINLAIFHSCDVNELKSLLKYSEYDASLLDSIRQANLRQRNIPQAYFGFPGTKGSMISLAPFQKWPIQNGWSFSTWFSLEPKAYAQPYLFNFRTGKSGLGYSAHFTGNCLVLTSIRVKGKGVQHCISYEFPSSKWIHCAITYHNKWRASEIKVYVNGQLSANIEMQWQVQTNEVFDKCFVGGSGSISSQDRSGELNCFRGQMSAIYLFNEGLSPAQICAIHRLGPSYMGQFKYCNESVVNLPQQICKVLYEEKLASSLFCLFTPAAVDGGTLCLQLAPLKSSTTNPAQNFFMSAPHAALLGQTKAISAQSICSTLQSLGCSRSLFPLLTVFSKKGNPEACASLVGFLCDLLESSHHWFANEIVQQNGFVVIACSLAHNARQLLTPELLDIFINLTKTLLTTSITMGDSLLLKHFMDNILFNPSLWIYAQPKLQIKLYTYFSTEFLHGAKRGNANATNKSTLSAPYMGYNPSSSAASNLANQTSMDEMKQSSVTETGISLAVNEAVFGEVRRVSTVLQLLHSLKYYYWRAEEKSINFKARIQSLRPSSDELITIRSLLLNFIAGLVNRSNSVPYDEVQGILNYISCCKQEDNIIDVLDLLENLLVNYPAALVPAMDGKNGVKVLFNLIGSESAKIRIHALRLLGLLLNQCSYKRKQDIMAPNNLYMLICEKLRKFRPLTLGVYNVLMDILIESSDCKSPNVKRGSRTGDARSNVSDAKICNSMIIKVIATLIADEHSDGVALEGVDIRNIFINDLWNLIANNRENRRAILQMSVWQHWLINLIESTTKTSQLVLDQVLVIFRVLLYHAIRYEYGGWRVWIDTLAIIHTKFSHDEFCNRCIGESSPLLKPQSSMTTTEESEKNVKASDVGDEKDNATQILNKNAESQQRPVSSISERIQRENSGLKLVDEPTQGVEPPFKAEAPEQSVNVKAPNHDEVDGAKSTESLDSVDLAPTREYRKLSIHSNEGEGSNTEQVQVTNQDESNTKTEIDRQQSMISISLDDQSKSSAESDLGDKNRSEDSLKHSDVSRGDTIHQQQTHQPERVSATPAFRIPEFRWDVPLIKLLNDLLFSIECDLYHWRCMSNNANSDAPPFLTKNGESLVRPLQAGNATTTSRNATNNCNQNPRTADSYMQKPENQIYIVNIIHLVSQLADNIIIASGGLLPLLAEATGGNKYQTQHSKMKDVKISIEGLTASQADSILYRLVAIVDMVVFASSHINLVELEADKNTTTGGILRQCLRLVLQTTVKNCLVINNMRSKGVSGGNLDMEFPKDIFDSYQGCSILSANGLFENSCLSVDNSDLIANAEYSPHQTPNSNFQPSLLPFQPAPIKDFNKLLQVWDINRIQACIYHNFNTESRQSQFLALSSLYFISVLMVSKYRDIIEPKQRVQKKNDTLSLTKNSSENVSVQTQSNDSGVKSFDPTSTSSSFSSVESNMIKFGQIQPDVIYQNQPAADHSISDILTKQLENTLDTVCPLLKSIMCDFSNFLSKTLLGSHGQDLVNKEANRTFKRPNASPVELVMLLCSQEWQNTLQKNAGLAFIELINEGRVLSLNMKDHIVRVAMEAEFIINGIVAEDVSKHQVFNLSCLDNFGSREHEEVLINSLINSAKRREYFIYQRFIETLSIKLQCRYRLDVWEDDDRRKRRFVHDPWSDEHQVFYSSKYIQPESDSVQQTTDQQRILGLQESIDEKKVNEHCLPKNAANLNEDDLMEHNDESSEDGDEHFDESVDERHYDSSGSDFVDKRIHHQKSHSTPIKQQQSNVDTTSKFNYIDQSLKVSVDQNIAPETTDLREQMWDYDDCGSVTDFTGSVVFATDCWFIWSIHAIPGVLQMTANELFFEPSQPINDAIDMLKRDATMKNTDEFMSKVNKDCCERVKLRDLDLEVLKYCEFLTCNGKISLVDIRAIFRRHYLLQPNAVEIFLAYRTSVMFAFSDSQTVQRVIKYLPSVGVGIKYGIPQSRKASLMTPRQLFVNSNMTQRWQRREISNFQYLIFLNTIAGRTYQDFNQYPVFPWILTNYESDELDLSLPSNFRDLSKPIGALNNKRRTEFIERYESWDNPKVPAFHYGTHYSTAAFTLNWLCRIRGSYNAAYLALQDGKYEEENRTFHSIGRSWLSSLVGGQQNVKELIPEFFYLPEMFQANFGLPEVEYPPWARSAEHFVRVHRLALESELVSCQLHQWIDLIFGYKQRGPEAIKSINTFYYMTYVGNVNLNMIQDVRLREAIEAQIKHFGQTPLQLTTEPHPPRSSVIASGGPLVFTPIIDEVSKVVKFPSHIPIAHIATCGSNWVNGGGGSCENVVEEGSSTGTLPSQSPLDSPTSIITITSNNHYQIHKWMPGEGQTGQPFSIDPTIEQFASASSTKRQLFDIDDLCSSIILQLTNSSDKSCDDIDEVPWPASHYIVTPDGRYIIMGAFYDNSFRVYSTENGKLFQVIYGHRAPITCLAGSVCNAAADFFVATGSQDCSVLLWNWNSRYAQIEGNGVSAVHNPLPKLSLSGHLSPVLSVLVSSELGLIVSGSKNLILVHELANGECLFEVDLDMPKLFGSYHLSKSDAKSHATIDSYQSPEVQNKRKTLMEASMLGEDNKHPSSTLQEPSRCPSASSLDESKFACLKEYCQSDYYITNLKIARELGFIVCSAVPPPKKHQQKQLALSSSNNTSKKNAVALLMTFNLKGTLIESKAINQGINFPKLGDNCIMQITKDGEHLILNDSPTTLKIYRTFDLQPLYAYNTNDIPNTLPEDPNKVRSLALVDRRYLLVGLDNGKIIVYNVDFKNI